MIKFIKKYRSLIFFALFLFEITFIYKLIQNHPYNVRIFKTPFDDRIPFLSIFIIPYLIYYFYIFIPFILSIRNEKSFFSCSISYFFAATILSLFYIFFQTTITRPDIYPDNIFNKLVLFIYTIDKPLNLFPSGHTTFSILANLCLIRINRKLSIIICPITLLIVLSTLFIKQHFIPDVISGIILSFLTYFLIFKRIYDRKD